MFTFIKLKNAIINSNKVISATKNHEGCTITVFLDCHDIPICLHYEDVIAMMAEWDMIVKFVTCWDSVPSGIG